MFNVEAHGKLLSKIDDTRSHTHEYCNGVELDFSFDRTQIMFDFVSRV